MKSSPMVLDQRLHTVKISLLLKFISIFNTMLTKIQAWLFCGNQWANSKILMEKQGTQNDLKQSEKEKKQVVGFSLCEWNQVS